MKCLICNSDRTHFKGKVSGYVAESTFDVYECADCTASWVAPLVSNHKLYEAIYENAKNINGYSRYCNLAESISGCDNPIEHIAATEDCYYGVIQSLKEAQTSNPNLRIIELGCGQGYLTYALANAGYDVIGVDISQNAIDLAVNRFGNLYHCGTLESFVLKHGRKPDVVVCTELIEHLENPVGFVKAVIDFLEPNGQFILTTPHKTVEPRTYWDTDLPPVHLWWFSKNSLQKVAERLSCKIDFFNFDAYYEQHSVKREFNNPEPSESRPIFDASLNLIPKPIKKFSMFKKLKRHLIPKALSRMNQARKELRSGKATSLCDDMHSYTICATFTKLT